MISDEITSYNRTTSTSGVFSHSEHPIANSYEGRRTEVAGQMSQVAELARSFQTYLHNCEPS